MTDSPFKQAVQVRLTLEQLTMWGDEEWKRKAKRTEVPPTEEQWASYREVVELLEKLREHDGFVDYGEAHVEEPIPTYEIEYLETEEEWAERVWALHDERDGFPKPLNWDQDVVDYYWKASPAERLSRIFEDDFIEKASELFYETETITEKENA